MPLVDVELPIVELKLPPDVDRFLREADQRIEEFQRRSPVPLAGFVPSDFVTVYHGLRTIAETNLAAGQSFCEWGSGFGVVTSLAAMLEFNACGIEIEWDLVDAARTLAEDFSLFAEFIHGSFIPTGSEHLAEEAYAADEGESFWLVTDTDNTYDELGLDPSDFDLVFAFPWPNEESLITRLFQSRASDGALLLTYNQLDSVRLQRKIP